MDCRTDEQLLLAARHDGDAFAEFYRRHAGALLVYLTRRLGGAELGADATAETFACALEGLCSYTSDKGVATAWLYGIARHQVTRALEKGRVENRYRLRVGIAEIRVAPDEISRIEEIATSEAVARQLEDSLAALPDEQRKALEARVLLEHSYDEIAAGANVTKVVARKRVSRALQAIRARLGETQ